MTHVLFGGCIALILLAAFASWMSWLSIAVNEGEKPLGHLVLTGAGSIALTPAKGEPTIGEHSASGSLEGAVMLSLGIAMALLLGAGYAVSLAGVLERKRSEQILNGVLLVGLAWGIVLIVWGAGWFVKIPILSQTMQREMVGGIQGKRNAEFTYAPFPGLGLFVMILSALFIAYLFSQVASRLNKIRKDLFVAEQMKGVSRKGIEDLYMGRLRIRIAEGVGLLLGAIVVVIFVRPWNADDLWKSFQPTLLNHAVRVMEVKN